MSSEACSHTPDDGKVLEKEAYQVGFTRTASSPERVQLDAETKRVQEELISLVQAFPLVFEAAFNRHPDLCPSAIKSCFIGRTGTDLTNTLAVRIKELGCPQDFIDLLHLAGSLTPAELGEFSNSISPDEPAIMITEILAAKANMMPTLIALYHKWYTCHWAGKEYSANYILPSTPTIR